MYIYDICLSQKSLIIDVWQGPKYACEFLDPKLNFKINDEALKGITCLRRWFGEFIINYNSLKSCIEDMESEWISSSKAIDLIEKTNKIVQKFLCGR